MLNLNLNWVSETIKTIKDWWPIVKSNFQQIQNNYNSHISGTSDKHLAEHITYSGVVSGASNVKQGIDNIKNSYNGHINGDSDKHAAEHITFASNRLTLPDDNVKNAIETVDMRIEQIIQEQSLDPNKDVEVVSSRVSAVYGEFDTLPERLDNTDNIVNDLNAKIDAPEYSAPQESTASVITLPNDVTKGQFSDIVLKGNTATNIVQNGNFANGTTGWTAAGATITVSNNTLVVTGNGTSNFAYANQVTNVKWASNKKIFNRQKVRVTNSSCTRIDVQLRELNVSAVKIISINSPVQNQWYELKDIFVATTQSNNIEIRIIAFYADAATANGKVMEIQEVMAIDMGASASDNPLYNLTVDEMNQRFPNWLQYGVVSTESARVTSTINFVKNGNCEDGIMYWLPYSGANISISDNMFKLTTTAEGEGVKQRIRIKPNTNYYLKGDVLGDIVIAVNDGDNAVRLKTGEGSFNTGVYDEINLIAYTPMAGTGYFGNIILIEGTEAPAEYTPYGIGGEVYIDGEFHSLLNGVKDEINVITGTGKQRTGKKVLQASDITALTTILANFDCISITKPTDMIAFTSTSSGQAYVEGYDSSLTADVSNFDSADNVNKTIAALSISDNIFVTFPKGTYTDLAAAKAAFAGKTLIYQLATEIPSKVTAQSLTAYPNGHIIVEPVTKVAKPYSNGITVDMPIQAIESITKIEDGVRTSVDLSKATIAGDKLSLTITDATNNEVYEIVYEYPSELSTLPTISYSYPMNIAAQVSENTKQVTSTSKSLNDFIAYQNAVNLEFDLRLTALEP